VVYFVAKSGPVLVAEIGPFYVAKGGPFLVAKIGILYLTIYIQSFNGTPVASILALIDCSMLERIVQLSLLSKAITALLCST